MIQSNELRKGNLFYDDYVGYCQVVSINENDTVNAINAHGGKVSGNFDLSKVFGIPLTEEILLKCGFELEDASGLRTEYVKDCITVVFDAADIALHIDEGDSYICVFYDNPAFQYLHQLQNLYFALTGQELTVQL